jgi:hypothetical protein
MDCMVSKMQMDNNKIENFVLKIRFMKNTITFAKETFASFKHLTSHWPNERHIFSKLTNKSKPN